MEIEKKDHRSTKSDDYYDKLNKETLLGGGQIKMLKKFCEFKDSTQIRNLGGIYYLFSKYWLHDLAEELKSENPTVHESDINDKEIVEQNKPLRFFSGDSSNWSGIEKIISTLEKVRLKVNKNLVDSEQKK